MNQYLRSSFIPPESILMKRLYFCLLIMVGGLWQSAYAQQGLSGNIVDSSESKHLSNTVIAVLRKTDSVLVKYTRSDQQGKFLIESLPSGKFILMVTHPRYADYVDQLEIKDAPIDLGNIFMTLRSQLLQEVIITNAAAIRMKGDTIEYKADSFYLSDGATVEDLLKKLPGIQVDKDGKITAHGETVQKVLVDGEEFFSDDPTVVTQNMLSDAIDKVQVYDKKSDQAVFTGVDDGQKQKTIDLKLKENRKKGYFGKLELGSDGQKYWNNTAMINAFRGKRKLSVFGVMSNTGRTGLNWDENMQYGTNQDMQINYDGDMAYIDGDNYDQFEDGGFYGQGLPKGWNAGGLYSNKWNEDKLKLNSSYQYKKLNTEGGGGLFSKYILPDTLYYQDEKGSSFSSRDRHTVNGTYEYQLDSSSSIKINGKGYIGKSLSLNDVSTASLDKFEKAVNRSERHTSSDMDEKNLNLALLYRKKFKKPGRTISLNVTQRYGASESVGFLRANYQYFDAFGSVKDEETTDQQKLRDNSSSVINSRIVYTEPLSPISILEFNYGLINNHANSAITALGKLNGGQDKYDDIIDSLTNNYALNVLTNSAGISYRYAKPKKITFSFGGNVSRADFNRRDLMVDTSLAYHFLNFSPRANLNGTIPGLGNIWFNYNGNTVAPTVEQLQPVKDNTDQLNQRIGNPDLKQAFRNRFSLVFSNYKLLSERSVFMNLGYNATANDFSTNNFIDALGKRLSQPVNVRGNNSAYLYGYYGKRLRDLGIGIGVNANANFSRNTNFVNGLENRSRSSYVGGGINIRWNKDKKYDINLAPNIGYTTSRSSIRPDETTHFFTQNHRVSVNLTLPLKIEFNTDCNFNLRQKTEAFDRNNNAIRWNARIDRKFLKNNAGIVRFSAFDILDQNIGFNRNVQTNFISERTYDTFRRYFMLSFLYNFTKNNNSQP